MKKIFSRFAHVIFSIHSLGINPTLRKYPRREFTPSSWWCHYQYKLVLLTWFSSPFCPLPVVGRHWSGPEHDSVPFGEIHSLARRDLVKSAFSKYIFQCNTWLLHNNKKSFFSICYDALVPCRSRAYKKWGRSMIITEMLPSSNVYLSNIFSQSAPAYLACLD